MAVEPARQPGFSSGSWRLDATANALPERAGYFLRNVSGLDRSAVRHTDTLGLATPPDLRILERSLVRARAAPAASLRVAVQVRQNMAPLADTPPLDELSDEPSPESRSVSLELVVSGHGTNGTAPRRQGSCWSRTLEGITL